MVSVLIVNWNTRDQLRDCLQSLTTEPSQNVRQIIVVDNDSQDGSAEMVAEAFPDVELIQSGYNAGYAAGNNLAFAAATQPFCLTLNPDTIVPAAAIDASVAHLQATDECGAVGVRLILPDGQTQRSVRGFPTLLGIFGYVTGLSKVFPNGALGSYDLPQFDYTKNQPAPQPMGTFLMFRREALAQIGDPQAPFDEQFPIFFNEVDLLYRLRQAGWRCDYLSEPIQHVHGASTRQVRPSMIWESHKSLVRYLKKHGRGPARWGLPIVAGLLYAAAFVRARGYHAGFRVKRHDL